MSYPSVGAMNAAQNVGVGLGGLLGHQGITSTSTISTNAYQPPFLDKDQHVFNCSKVENGWTFTYRSKTHIASTVDEMMEQMKAAMVVERIEK